MSANAYALTRKQTIKAPNGYPIVIWEDSIEEYVQLSQIAQALGYARGTALSTRSLFKLLFVSEFTYFQKQTACASSYVMYLKDVVPFLQEFIKLTLTVSSKSSRYADVQDNARMEAERLIEVFNVEVFGKPSSVTVKPIEQSDSDGNSNLKNGDDVMGVKTDELTCERIVVAPNGYPIKILTDGSKQYVQTSLIGLALGYSEGILSPKSKSILNTIFVKHGFARFIKRLKSVQTHVMYLGDVIPFLQTIIQELSPSICFIAVCKNAERLIEILKVEVFDKLNSATVSPAEQSTNQTELNFPETKEDIQMDNNTVNVPVVTVADLEDINDRAEAIAKIFGASKKDALRAAVTLKSPEINRELTPLLELLA